jgi:hypothetical protein
VDRFLRELDKVLAGMGDAERATAVQGLRQLITSLPALNFLNGVSKMAGAGMITSISIAVSGGRRFDEWFAKLQKRAAEIAPHVQSLFQAV